MIFEEVYVGDCFGGCDVDTGDVAVVGNGSVLLVISILPVCDVSEIGRAA